MSASILINQYQAEEYRRLLHLRDELGRLEQFLDRTAATAAAEVGTVASTDWQVGLARGRAQAYGLAAQFLREKLKWAFVPEQAQ